MATHLPLTEFARVLQQHLTCPAPLQKRDQTETSFQEIEQALATSETTVFICGEQGRPAQLQVIDGLLCDPSGETDFLILDAFEDAGTEAEQRRIANFAQQLAEQRAPVRLVLFGVSESVRELLKPHESCYDCVLNGQTLQTNASDCISSKKGRLTGIRAPHHVYVLSEKIFWEMLSDPTFARVFR